MKPTVVFTCLMLIATSFLVAGCEQCDQKIPLSLDPEGKLHVFKDDASLRASGVPSTALTYVIATNTDAFARTDVPLRNCTSLLDSLEGEIEYEYHADSRNSAASIEFVIKDPQQNVLWKKQQTFRPAKLKTQTQETFVLPISLAVDGLNLSTVTIEAIPRSAGDFAFFVYGLSGVLKTQ